MLTERLTKGHISKLRCVIWPKSYIEMIKKPLPGIDSLVNSNTVCPFTGYFNRVQCKIPAESAKCFTQ